LTQTARVRIENPVINSPLMPPTRHFDFDENEITDRLAGHPSANTSLLLRFFRRNIATAQLFHHSLF